MAATLRRIAACLAFLLLVAATGCKSHQATIIDTLGDDVEKPTSGWGLRKLDPKDYPDMKLAWGDKSNLERAIDKSIKFLNAASSARFYPSTNPGDTITHDQILGTLYDVKDLLHKNISADAFQQQLLSRYDCYTSVGYNSKGDVWFTAYYTPIYQGSLTPTAEFKYPVYSRLPNIVSDPITGEVKGTYPSRKELVASGQLRGHELVYFRKPIEPFIIQVQGSAKVVLQNGQTLYLGYAGTNGREHSGLGSELVKEGKIDKKHLSLPAVLAYFDAHPDQLDSYVLRDDRFTFLKVYGPEEWPAGSLGVQVTANRSLATDKSIFPRASLTFLDISPAANEASSSTQRFTLDQDTGGAIRAAGRADIYMGIGEQAGDQAGRVFAQGRLYYLFLKPELINPASFPNQKAAQTFAAPPRRGARKPGQPAPKNPGTPMVPMPGDGTGGDMFPGAVQK